MCAPPQIRSGDAGGKAEVVLDLRARSGLAARRLRLNHQRAQPFAGSIHGCRQAGGASAHHYDVIEILSCLGAQTHPCRQLCRLRVHQRAAVREQHHRQPGRIQLPFVEHIQRIVAGSNVHPAIRHMVAGEKRTHLVVLERPAVPNHAQPLERRLVARVPVFQQVAQHRIELFLRRIPGLVEVVVDAGGVDGLDGGLGVCVGGEQNPLRLGINLPRTLQELDPGNPRHALVAADQGHRLLAGLQLCQRVQGSLGAGGAHHAVGGPVLAAQVLHHGFQHVYVVVYCQEDRPRHIFSV